MVQTAVLHSMYSFETNIIAVLFCNSGCDLTARARLAGMDDRIHVIKDLVLNKQIKYYSHCHLQKKQQKTNQVWFVCKVAEKETHCFVKRT